MKIEVWHYDEELTPQMVERDLECPISSKGGIVRDNKGKYWEVEEILLVPGRDLVRLFVEPRPSVKKVRPKKGKEIAHEQR